MLSFNNAARVDNKCTTNCTLAGRAHNDSDVHNHLAPCCSNGRSILDNRKLVRLHCMLWHGDATGRTSNWRYQSRSPVQSTTVPLSPGDPCPVSLYRPICVQNSQFLDTQRRNKFKTAQKKMGALYFFRGKTNFKQRSKNLHLWQLKALESANLNTFEVDFYRAMLCMRGTSHGPVSVSVCVCLSQVGVLLKQLNIGSHK